ncbi:MAG: NAD-dependent epimerase/dehydratase family protein [Lachnospiraceae bacterium]|nr:NAD-dependent epimerase/dehydratase family protein [Lachnospiraceae bacterium]
MKVLLVGGTGTISTGVQKVIVEERGYDLYILNRGNSVARMRPEAHSLIADYNDEPAVKAALQGYHFDTVVDFRIQGVADMEKAVRCFDGITDQYILISSGTVYRKPLSKYLVTEDMPLGNYHSAYARNKVASEMTLRKYIEKGFPGVIVRPSLTYADFNPLVAMNSRKNPYSIIWRMRKNKPVIVHGDGTNLWTITHNTDFGRGISGLFGNPATIGEAFHITSDEVLDWNTIYTDLAHAAGVDANLVHISSDTLGDFVPDLRESLEGDHAVSAVFDNTKIKKFVPDFVCKVPWAEGAKRIVAWFDEDPKARETVDDEWNAQMDEIIGRYREIMKP